MRKNVTLRAAACLALGVAAWGCSSPPPVSADPGAAAEPLPSFDGRYQGVVQLAASGNGGWAFQCATDPRISLQVANNAFVYVQPHRNLEGTSPYLTAEVTTTTYNGAITSDGTVRGTGTRNGTISGRLTGTHMSGEINGLLCHYTFTAERQPS